MKYFMAGIKGSGMSGLACMLHDLGHEIIGYDDLTYYAVTEPPLKKRGIPIYYDIDMLDKGMTVIHTAAIHEDHKVLKKARELNLEVRGYFEMIGDFTRKYDSICIAGTHGKTTTTSMLSRILDNTIGTNYLIGDGTGFINSSSNNFVIESCEFERHFLNYDPKYAIITNIELDHVDCYKNVEEIIDVFQQFIDKVAVKVIACGDDDNIRKLKSSKIVYYGFNDSNDIIAKNLVQTRNGSSFDCFINKEFYGHFDIHLFGKHMILNSLACIYMSYLLGIKKCDIINYLDTFGGAKRRFSEEVVGDCILVDDYAHHPTEIKTVIETSRQKYPDRKVVAVLIPYTLSRAEAFYKEFADVISLADKAFVTDIEPAREKIEDYPNISSEMIIERVKNAEHISLAEINKLYNYPNSVILFMGCKDSFYLRDAYKKGKNL